MRLGVVGGAHEVLSARSSIYNPNCFVSMINYYYYYYRHHHHHHHHHHYYYYYYYYHYYYYYSHNRYL